MAKYILDTNVVIDMLRSVEERQAYEQFLQHRLPVTFMSAVVGMELLAGALSDAHARALETEVLGPFHRRDRVFAPSSEATLLVGRILGRITMGGKALPNRSFINDLLIATSCRERGVTVITRDADFQRVRRLIPGLAVVAPYPAHRISTTDAQ